MNNHFESQEENIQRYSTAGGRNKVGKIYKQFYRKAWEEIPEFKEWLTSIPGERSKAYCKICERSLHAHRLSLTKHTVSLKHMRLAQRRAQERMEGCFDDDPPLEVSVGLEGQVEIEEEQTSVDEYDHHQVVTGGVMGHHHHQVKVKEEMVLGGEGAVSGEEVTIPIGGGGGGVAHHVVAAPHHHHHHHLEEHHLQQLREQQRQEEEEEEDSNQGVDHHQMVYSTASTPHQQQIVYEQNHTHLPQSADNQPVSILKIIQKKKNDKPQITTHVIDISKGMPVAGLSVSLYQLVDGRWILLSEGSTNGDGRWGELSGTNGIKAGRFKLHFDTERYFLLRHQPTFYPFVEIVFDMCSPNDHYHLPLILGPHGFTTYKGC